MLTVASADRAETHSNATFEALMWSMARPGETRHMPEAGMAPIVEALIDLECTVFADSPELGTRIVATGAELTDRLEAADHVFLDKLDAGDRRLMVLNCGSALYPDEGATLAAPTAHRGQRVRLTGPGIEGEREVALDVSAEFWALRAQLCAYPEGFDLLLVDGQAVIAIPRSTQVEVL